MFSESTISMCYHCVRPTITVVVMPLLSLCTNQHDDCSCVNTWRHLRVSSSWILHTEYLTPSRLPLLRPYQSSTVKGQALRTIRKTTNGEHIALKMKLSRRTKCQYPNRSRALENSTFVQESVKLHVKCWKYKGEETYQNHVIPKIPLRESYNFSLIFTHISRSKQKRWNS